MGGRRWLNKSLRYNLRISYKKKSFFLLILITIQKKKQKNWQLFFCVFINKKEDKLINKIIRKNSNVMLLNVNLHSYAVIHFRYFLSSSSDCISDSIRNYDFRFSTQWMRWALNFYTKKFIFIKSKNSAFFFNIILERIHEENFLSTCLLQDINYNFTELINFSSSIN